jgi:hypothetical protein
MREMLAKSDYLVGVAALVKFEQQAPRGEAINAALGRYIPLRQLRCGI